MHLLKNSKMKNYKLLQDRPELTNEQIKAGMDFNKIKNNAALEKSTALKTIFIKGLLGVIAVSVVAGIYMYYNDSIPEKASTASADANPVIHQSNDSISRPEIPASERKKEPI